MFSLGRIGFLPGTFGSLATVIFLFVCFHILNIPSNIIGVAVIDVDEDSEAISKKITSGSVLMSVTYQKVTGNMTYQSTVKVVNPDQVYKILQERKDAGDERILLRVWRPEYRVSSLVALSFNKEQTD